MEDSHVLGIVLSFVGTIQIYKKIYKSWRMCFKVEHFRDDIPLKMACTRHGEERALGMQKSKCPINTRVNLKGFLEVSVKTLREIHNTSISLSH